MARNPLRRVCHALDGTKAWSEWQTSEWQKTPSNRLIDLSNGSPTDSICPKNKTLSCVTASMPLRFEQAWSCASRAVLELDPVGVCRPLATSSYNSIVQTSPRTRQETYLSQLDEVHTANFNCLNPIPGNCRVLLCIGNCEQTLHQFNFPAMETGSRVYAGQSFLSPITGAMQRHTSSHEPLLVWGEQRFACSSLEWSGNAVTFICSDSVTVYLS